MSLFNPDIQQDFLKRKLLQNEINQIDVYFSELMAKLSKTSDTELIKTFSELSYRISQQDSCMDVSDKLAAKLHKLETVTEISDDNMNQSNTPLILAGNKLYLQKYFQYETKIARDLIKRNVTIENSDFKSLELLFPTNLKNNDGIDWQKVAAFQCLSRQLAIITGGPGTGKTTTIVKILAALLDQNPDLRIKLAAPTGKAAAKLSESIISSINGLPEMLNAKIPEEVSTVHRLLGMRNKGHAYRYHQDNKMAVDLLVLDEASMIDLAMFTRILEALPDHCRLIILGDPEQLLSVDVGAVLTDLFQLGSNYTEEYRNMINHTLGYEMPANSIEGHPLSNALCHLRTSYRFSPELGIGKLAASIRENVELDFINDDEVNYVQAFKQDKLKTALVNQYQAYFDLIQEKANASALLNKFEETRVLSPLREGEFGIESLNDIIESSLYQHQSIPIFYHGKAIMVTQNDYVLELFNGDIGICFESREGVLKVAFHDQDAGIREIPIVRLPSWETCFVMSVHKSQGSEFQQVSLVIPPTQHYARNLFTRELIYTAVTRAKSHVTIYAKPKDLLGCLAQRSNRLSGLQERFKMEWHAQKTNS